MCLRPYILKNPSHGLHHNFWQEYMKDTDSYYITVPCGVCKECRSRYQTFLLQRAQLMASKYHMFFMTLTYNQQSLPHTKRYTHLDGNERTYAYADINDFRLFIKRLRKYGAVPPGAKYICCNEYGGLKHRPHFHCLLFVPKFENFQYHYQDGCVFTFDQKSKWSCLNYERFLWTYCLHEWRRNTVKSTKKPVYQQLCTYVEGRDGRRTYDLHYVQEFKDGKDAVTVARYVTKYVLKYDEWYSSLEHALFNNLEYDDYKELRTYIRPRCLISKGFGGMDMFKDEVNSMYERSYKTDGIIKFLNEKGQWVPMSKYLKDKFLTPRQQLDALVIQKAIAGFSPFDSNADFRTYEKFKDYISGWHQNEDYKKREKRCQDVYRILNSYNKNETILYTPLIFDDE